MPVPAPNLTPPFNTVRLSHVEYGVTDLSCSRAFYVDMLGMQVTGEDASTIYLRAMEERGHHCIILKQSDQAEARYLAFKVWDNDNLDRAAAFFTAKGLPVTWVTSPHITRAFRTRDPQGVPLEFYAHMDRLPPIHQQYKLYHGVRPLRIDHFNCFSPDVDAAVAFWNEIGFRVTEYTEDDATGRLWAAWMHRKGGVHDIAFTNGSGPRLHHTAFWVPTPMNIIDLLDLMSTTGWLSNIERGPGRHGISNAFFLYIRDPDGHRIRWGLKDPQRQTLWGAPAPPSWFEEGSRFAGTSATPSSLKSTPIIAP
jgi:catechol 2,3-dioxygenase